MSIVVTVFCHFAVGDCAILIMLDVQVRFCKSAIADGPATCPMGAARQSTLEFCADREPLPLIVGSAAVFSNFFLPFQRPVLSGLIDSNTLLYSHQGNQGDVEFEESFMV